VKIGDKVKIRDKSEFLRICQCFKCQKVAHTTGILKERTDLPVWKGMMWASETVWRVEFKGVSGDGLWIREDELELLSM
jgi:hypothetical protein